MIVDCSELESLLKEDEGRLLEYKRDWFPPKAKRGKAELCKHVLAIANSLEPGEVGWLIFGVEDKPEGRTVWGVEEPWSPEALAQVLADYTNPAPVVELHNCELEGGMVSGLRVLWSPHRPHYATREVDQVLSTDAVYARRGPTVGRLKPTEHAELIRSKEGGGGAPASTLPIAVGFVELPSPGKGSTYSVRISNLTDEPVSGISLIVDQQLVGKPWAMCRVRHFTNLALGPGESQEADGRVPDRSFYDGLKDTLIEFTSYSWEGWIDLKIYVQYRDRRGFLREIREAASVER